MATNLGARPLGGRFRLGKGSKSVLASIGSAVVTLFLLVALTFIIGRLLPLDPVAAVVGDDGKSESRSVVLGQQIGSYYIVKSGLSANDTVVVEGLSSLTEGKDLAVTMVTPEDMGFSLDEDTTPYDTMTSSDASSGSES